MILHHEYNRWIQNFEEPQNLQMKKKRFDSISDVILASDAFFPFRFNNKASKIGVNIVQQRNR